ncbi:hypothetical protein QAD02_015053 [Eretmocerus hayati]|uniref:Uncharacterized protein n=1 Tax=Eretmocerus hayati TaxID=131215 RepID=A0ACC2P761_9HYME|nr:hypothetical protein QAD02_015053 [Eretmocerus hayati]
MTLEGSNQPKRLEEIRRQIEEASREEIESVPTTDALIRERIRELNKTLEKSPNNNERLPLLEARRLALIGALEFHRDNLQYATSPSPLEIEAAESNRLLRASGVQGLDTYGLNAEEESRPVSPAPSDASSESTVPTAQQAPFTPPSEPEAPATPTDSAAAAIAQADITGPTPTATSTGRTSTRTRLDNPTATTSTNKS